ncbi:hypothetical protein Ancab_035413 [Ancistrocladus abbreviatus]
MKESVPELQSSLQRMSDGGSALANYTMSRKKIKKMVSKCLGHWKKVEKLEKDGSNVSVAVRLLNEVEEVSLLTLKTALAYASGVKATSTGHGWSLVAKLMNSKHVSCEDANEMEKIDLALCALKTKKSSADSKVMRSLLKQLETLEMNISELEEGMEAVSRCLVKTLFSPSKKRMATSFANQRTTCHARSISLPSRPHPLDASVEDQLSRLRASETGASSSASSICHKLSGIKELCEIVNDLIQLPLNQQALSHPLNHDEAEEVLDGSLGLLDLCSSTMDVLSQMKASVLELQSSLRRRSGEESDLANYTMSRKKINKLVSKCFGNFKKLDKSSALVHSEKDSSTLSVVRTLRELEAVTLSTLKFVLAYVSGTKAESRRHGWSLVAKLMQSKRASCETAQDANEVDKIDHALYALGTKKSSTDVKSVQSLLKQLETLELSINEIEDDLEAVSRCLVKTRVSLLNVLNQ